MRTDKDFAAALALFLGAFLIGGALFFLISCRMTPADAQHAVANVGYALQDAGPWLPPPFGVIAEVGGGLLAVYGAHKGTKHVMRRRAAARVAKAA